jgi:hypothetical protein
LLRLRLSKRTGTIPWQGYPGDRNWFHPRGQVTGNGFTTNLGSYADIVGGTSNQFSILFNTAGLAESTTRSTTFQIAMSDKVGMSGATPTNTLYVTAQVIVVPEPATVALAGMGAAVAGWVGWSQRRKVRG